MKNRRFEVKYTEGGAFGFVTKIIVDKETGVNYLWINAGYGHTITPLLDADGKPIVTK